MSSRAFEVGDRVSVVQSGSDGRPSNGIVRSVDKSRRRTDPFFIYYVELPGQDTLIDFEFRELELVAPIEDKPGLKS